MAIRTSGSAAVLIVLLSIVISPVSRGLEIDEDAGIAQSTTGVLGLSQITLSVRDLDASLAFYQASTDYALVRRGNVAVDEQAAKLYGRSTIAYRSALLRAPNLLFELIEFEHNRQLPIQNQPPQGPGMTHTCFQSPMQRPGFDRFAAAGAEVISEGGRPIDLGGYGVTYAYAYDPEGNMIELEQLDGEVLARTGYDAMWSTREENLWMSQVALATPDIDALMRFYQTVLGYKPYRRVEIEDNPKVDAIAGIPNLRLRGGWFRLSDTSKVLEFWQYLEPETPAVSGSRDPTTPGYSFVLEVDDIHAHYARLLDQGVHFFSEPVVHGGVWQVFAQDIDHNVFALRQPVDPESPYSVRVLDRLTIR